MRSIINAFFAAAIFVSGLSSAFAQSLVGTPNWAASQVSVATSATLVAPSRPTRLNVRITQITGTQQVFCGPTNGVTLANGQLVGALPRDSFDIDTRAEVWCIASTSAQTVSVAENY